MPPATTSQAALQNLQSFGAGVKSPDQTYQDTSNSLGIPAAQQQVTGLRGAINNTTQLLSQVAPSVMGRTSNSLVTSAQADRQIGNEQQPLNDQLNKENTDYSGASSDLQNLMGEANTRTTNAVAGQQNQLSYLQGIYSDLASSEKQAQDNQLARDQLNASIAAQKASAASSPSLVGGASGTAAAGGTGAAGTMSKNSAGGYAFSSATGQPISMGQYLASSGYSGTGLIQAAAQLLSKSNNGDMGIANAISSGRYTPAQLEKLYPQVFGGL